ncbi:hypothetical protein ACMWDH_14825, partial [Klebsiella pneumoniae]
RHAASRQPHCDQDRQPRPGAPKVNPHQRDAEGRWQFSFTLTGARADAD